MTAYYNEHDPKAAAWLRELIAAGLITNGEVDERSIEDVAPSDLVGFDRCHFFAGIGGWDYALQLAGWDGPVWTGSCPCQPFSAAGKGASITDPRHLWPAWFRLIRECRPAVVFGEQVAAAIRWGWLDLVCDDLEREGYAVGASCLPAASVGAPHIRQRLWFVADAAREREGGRGVSRPGEGDCALAQPEAEQRPERAGVSGLMDDAESRHRRLPIQRRGSRQTGAEPERSGEVGELGHADGGERRQGITEAEQPEGAVAVSGLAHVVGDASCEGRQGRDGPDICRAGRWEEGGIVTSAGAWADLLWLPCRDGKARPTQPGLQPLVARLPGGVVPSGDPSPSEANASAEARVWRLRGYGNSIVPAVAAGFVRAYQDVLDVSPKEAANRLLS